MPRALRRPGAHHRPGAHGHPCRSVQAMMPFRQSPPLKKPLLIRGNLSTSTGTLVSIFTGWTRARRRRPNNGKALRRYKEDSLFCHTVFLDWAYTCTSWCISASDPFAQVGEPLCDRIVRPQLVQHHRSGSIDTILLCSEICDWSTACDRMSRFLGKRPLRRRYVHG